jgi:hypothetical protein
MTLPGPYRFMERQVTYCLNIEDRERILYESEKIFLNGDRHIAVDFYIKSATFAVEVDGSAHDKTQSYDAGRDRWLF